MGREEGALDFEFQGARFEAEEVCQALALQGQLDGVLREALRTRCYPEWAEALGLEAGGEQVQAFADEYRAAHGLHEAADTAAFLARAGLDEDGFVAYCQAGALRRAVRDHLGTEEAVHEHFMAHGADFDCARVSRLVVAEEELANELRMRVAEDGEDFHALARQLSLDPDTRPAGGYAGRVRRQDLGNEAAARVFSAAAGALVGPVAEGDRFVLLLVEELQEGLLDDEARELIKDRLLEEWEQARLAEPHPA